ncbi:MAG TPA: hypothetical protein PLS60_14155, partial [Arenimonas sp.]|nr:hypothetical protein [Arenimonas sp.]
MNDLKKGLPSICLFSVKTQAFRPTLQFKSPGHAANHLQTRCFMARTKKTVKTVRTATKKTEAGSRDLLLAGIGAVSLGRKKAISSYANALQNVVDFSTYLNDSVKNSEKTAKKF